MKNLVLMQQVHGNNVQIVTSSDIGKTIPECDGLITNDPKLTLGVRVADCLPIVIKDKKSRVFGIVHAGWRGLDNGIIEKAVRKVINEFSSNPGELEVNIGPHICRKHYEVKSDVSSRFRSYPGAIIQGINPKKLYLDLANVAISQLVAQGINPRNIKVDKRCTFEDSSLPSFRRNKTSDRLTLSASIP